MFQLLFSGESNMGFHEDSRETHRPVVIFGASVLGEVALEAMQISGLRPVCFGDNDREKQSKGFRGYRVAGLDEIHAQYPDAIMVIGAGRYYDEIRNQLFSRGYRHIYSEAEVIEQIDFSRVQYNQIKGIAWRLAQLGHLSRIKEISTDSLHLERLNVVVTERCTLRCRHCSSLMPLYSKPQDCNTDLLLQSLDRVLACVDFIYHVEVLGGETLLNRDLPAIINKLTKSNHILQIDVITNGTILPRRDLLQCLTHESICVVVNDYGSVSKKKDELFEMMKGAGIKTRQNRHWAWADLGGFERRNRDEPSLTQLFHACNFHTCTELLNGRLHRCPRSSHGTETGIIPKYPEDFINITDPFTSDETLKERLRTFFADTTFVHACDHCNGNKGDSLSLTPAEQQNKGERDG
jgi:hypothetical protein